jgi:hypothetical protein
MGGYGFNRRYEIGEQGIVILHKRNQFSLIPFELEQRGLISIKEKG